MQGDSVLVEIYKDFGVHTHFEGNSIKIKKVQDCQLNTLNFDLINSPDIAQTIAVTCFGLGISCHLTGLHTLKIKETDRLLALKTELEKLGGQVHITDHSLQLEPNSLFSSDTISATLNEQVETISTYNDHRMAMAFAPLALKRSLKIEDAMVVSKSYPDFWEDLKSIGFEITKR